MAMIPANPRVDTGYLGTSASILSEREPRQCHRQESHCHMPPPHSCLMAPLLSKALAAQDGETQANLPATWATFTMHMISRSSLAPLFYRRGRAGSSH